MRKSPVSIFHISWAFYVSISTDPPLSQFRLFLWRAVRLYLTNPIFDATQIRTLIFPRTLSAALALLVDVVRNAQIA